MAAPFWDEIYERRDVYSVIHQERRTISLSLFDRAAVPPHSRVLEIGCGAGFSSVEIAKRGHNVLAVDVAERMIALTRSHAGKAGVGDLVRTSQCDIHHLPCPDRVFEAVMAIGVLPWLPSMSGPIREMNRVLRPGGILIVNADNRWRMTYVADPSAWIRPAAVRLASLLGLRHPPTAPRTAACSRAAFDAELRRQGFEVSWSATLGFGPFWLVNKLLPDAFSVGLHHFLQRLADGGLPLIRGAGTQYIVIARKVSDHG